MQQLCFLHRQVQDNRRADVLGDHFSFLILPDNFFIEHLLMGRMLVDDIEFILILNQPVSIKNLTNQPVPASRLLGEHPFLKQI